MAFFSRIRSLAVLAATAGLVGAAPAPAPSSATAPTPGARDNAIYISELYCISIGHGRGECHSAVSGATGTVTYAWNPKPYAGSGDFVLIYCNAGTDTKVTLTVTDSAGGSDYAETWFYCGDAV